MRISRSKMRGSETEIQATPSVKVYLVGRRENCCKVPGTDEQKETNGWVSQCQGMSDIKLVRLQDSRKWRMEIRKLDE